MGLALRTGATATFMGTQTPMTPPASVSPTNRSTRTIAQQAYGVMGTGGGLIKSTPGYGTLAVGTVCLVALVYLYWSLPR